MAEAARAGTGITPQDAASDAALCSNPFKGAGLQVPWGMDSPSATVAWESTSVCAGRGWALSFHRPKSSEKAFKVLFLSLCGCREEGTGLEGAGVAERGSQGMGALLCCFKPHRAQTLAASLCRLALCVLWASLCGRRQSPLLHPRHVSGLRHSLHLSVARVQPHQPSPTRSCLEPSATPQTLPGCIGHESLQWKAQNRVWVTLHRCGFMSRPCCGQSRPPVVLSGAIAHSGRQGQGRQQWQGCAGEWWWHGTVPVPGGVAEGGHHGTDSVPMSCAPLPLGCCHSPHTSRRCCMNCSSFKRRFY